MSSAHSTGGPYDPGVLPISQNPSTESRMAAPASAPLPHGTIPACPDKGECSAPCELVSKAVSAKRPCRPPITVFIISRCMEWECAYTRSSRLYLGIATSTAPERTGVPIRSTLD
jgi:hypothetical protein